MELKRIWVFLDEPVLLVWYVNHIEHLWWSFCPGFLEVWTSFLLSLTTFLVRRFRPGFGVLTCRRCSRQVCGQQRGFFSPSRWELLAVEYGFSPSSSYKGFFIFICLSLFLVAVFSVTPHHLRSYSIREIWGLLGATLLFKDPPMVEENNSLLPQMVFGKNIFVANILLLPDLDFGPEWTFLFEIFKDLSRKCPVILGLFVSSLYHKCLP